MAFGGLYTSMAGLETSSERLDTVSQNLANANTQGYAAQQTAAMALPYQGKAPLSGADVIALAENVNTKAGPLNHTGSPFDIAVKNGWLLVRTQNGGDVLTRNGHLTEDANGVLTTAIGEPVLNTQGNPISLPMLRNITIGRDGLISGVPADQAGSQPRTYGSLFIAATPTGGQLTSLGDSLYGLPAGTKPTPARNASVLQGYLEGSNVNTVKSMVDLIDVSRSYQFETQVMAESAKTETALDQIMMA